MGLQLIPRRTLMKKDVITNYFGKILCGFLLYIICVGQSWLIYANLSENEFNFIFILLFSLGIFTSIFAMIYKNKTTRQTLISACLLIVSFISFFVIGGYLGIVHWLESFLKINIHSYSENISGLIMIVFILTTIVVIIFTLSIQLIIIYLCNRKHGNYK